MKKQCCVKILIIMLLVLNSCTSLKKNDETLVNTALNLANKYCELNQLDEALDVYNKALRYGNDYRLLYNKSIVQAELNDFEGAVTTAQYGYKLYKRNDFNILLSELYFYSNRIEDAYNSALDLWEQGVDDKRVVAILYSVNPDEWAMINKVIN